MSPFTAWLSSAFYVSIRVTNTFSVPWHNLMIPPFSLAFHAVFCFLLSLILKQQQQLTSFSPTHLVFPRLKQLKIIQGLYKGQIISKYRASKGMCHLLKQQSEGGSYCEWMEVYVFCSHNWKRSSNDLRRQQNSWSLQHSQELPQLTSFAECCSPLEAAMITFWPLY